MTPFDPQQSSPLPHTDGTTQAPSELKQLKFALDQSAIVAITDARGIITFANEKFCEISQFPINELLGKSHKVVNSGFHPKSFFEGMWRTISSGKVWSGEIKNRTKTGSHYWVQTSIIPFLDENLRPYQYVSIRFDITGQKEAEDKLQKYAGELENNLKTIFESEENFKQLFNASFDGTIVHKNGFILNANQAASKIFETPIENLLGGQLLNFFPEETHKLFIDTFEANQDVHFETVLPQKGRSRAFFKISSKQLLYKGVKASLLTIRDETEQRILQSQLAQQERLASVGFLASGLAHEIGTPLGIIRGRAEYLSLYPENQKSVRSNMEIIVNQIDRISKLIYSLLN
ncbi:MAG: PAS domain-containing protein, partial [Deltaproteobacteria bacterium]